MRRLIGAHGPQKSMFKSESVPSFFQSCCQNPKTLPKAFAFIIESLGKKLNVTFNHGIVCANIERCFCTL